LSALVRNAAQTATGGFADELVGAMMAISDRRQPVTRENIQGYTDIARQQVAESRVEHPWLSAGGTLAGAALNPLNKLLGPLTAGLSPTAATTTTGAVLGGLQGFGEGTGSAKERLPSMALGTGVGAVGGVVVS